MLSLGDPNCVDGDPVDGVIKDRMQQAVGAKGASTMRLGEPFVGFPLANASAIFWSN